MQNAVTFKGVNNQLEIRIAPDVPFEVIAAAIVNKFESGRKFFAGSSCVYITGELDAGERMALNSLLKHNYGIMMVEYSDSVPKESTQRPDTPVRAMFREFSDAPEAKL